MNHDWVTEPKIHHLLDGFVCKKCGVIKTNMHYSNLPGGKIGASEQIISIEKGDLDCDLMVLRRVMLS
jgi:hypothetical protein